MVDIINGYLKDIRKKYISLITVEKNCKFQLKYKIMFTTINLTIILLKKNIIIQMIMMKNT